MSSWCAQPIQNHQGICSQYLWRRQTFENMNNMLCFEDFLQIQRTKPVLSVLKVINGNLLLKQLEIFSSNALPSEVVTKCQRYYLCTFGKSPIHSDFLGNCYRQCLTRNQHATWFCILNYALVGFKNCKQSSTVPGRWIFHLAEAPRPTQVPIFVTVKELLGHWNSSCKKEHYFDANFDV